MAIDETITTDEISAITQEAYIYSFPMMMGYRFGYATFLAPDSPSHAGPPNHGPYGKAATLDYRFKNVITPNADTPYSFALLDFRTGPLVLSVPDVPGRYYVMQLEDLYGQNDLFVGSRATGAEAGTYFISGPTWDGDVSSGFTDSHQFETDLVFLLGRTQLLSKDYTPALAEVMRGYRLESYEEFRGNDAPALPSFDWPQWDDGAYKDERFITYLNGLLPLCQPTPAEEVELMARFAKIGIGPGLAYDPEDLPSDVRQAIADGVGAARAELASASESIGENINCWMSMDAFGNRAAYDGNYLRRAAESMVGWGGNDKIEAYYPMARFDSDGAPFDGDANYELKLETMPPVNAFWSVTMYDTSFDGTAGYMIENPIDRYLINSTTEGLQFNDDGSLTISIQRTEPTDPKARANWLPSPSGKFYLALRMYWPKQDALDGTWLAPGVVRTS